MCDRFIPPYKRNLRKKLQRLEQGDMFVQEYYEEFQKCIICCGIVEDMEDKIVRFYGGTGYCLS
jgi:Icc-related predicted phosphoesterase